MPLSLILVPRMTGKSPETASAIAQAAIAIAIAVQMTTAWERGSCRTMPLATAPRRSCYARSTLHAAMVATRMPMRASRRVCEDPLPAPAPRPHGLVVRTTR